MENEFKTTVGLDKAAFLLMQGARFLGVNGSKPYNCKFVLLINKKMLINNEEALVNYREYMKKRQYLKKRSNRVFNVIK